jgi:hypothetical protein
MSILSGAAVFAPQSKDVTKQSPTRKIGERLADCVAQFAVD